MRKLPLFMLFLLGLVLFNACSGDDTQENPEEEMEQTGDPTDDDSAEVPDDPSIPLQNIDSGISIVGATRITGTPPAPWILT
ncbi:Hypothetical protein I595_1632 [Croceitalea dokdonensis DOKDO 023]|uniref:Secreted protein n=1 Tax=Croceitalea dokdonensis DOKDO 023 TaxID=1300341 RepID=A0A0P7AZI5_9FLAO|nr:hypothetical protein [Croceitalea dokdonensis]KPM31984.1 Hypothetical protein I595_1632 [Croceitalea dokdonensis DOKDO 023]